MKKKSMGIRVHSALLCALAYKLSWHLLTASFSVIIYCAAIYINSHNSYFMTTLNAICYYDFGGEWARNKSLAILTAAVLSNAKIVSPLTGYLLAQ